MQLFRNYKLSPNSQQMMKQELAPISSPSVYSERKHLSLKTAKAGQEDLESLENDVRKMC